jgi:hypothetical protein
VTLSVLCPTRDPGPRVRALLEPLREVADEILVAADSRIDPDQLGEHAAVADRLLRFEFGTPNGALAWLHEQCRGDWVLTIAGDEVASAALIQALPEHTASRRALQVWLPMRWLFPDQRHWLAEWPWFPDFHNRLVRNDGTLRFPGLKHTHATPVLPARWIEAPLYHLDLALSSIDERREKVHRYDSQTAGMTLPGGDALNATYYLPELHATRPAQAVPSEDVELIGSVMRADSRGASPPEVTEPARLEDIIRLWAARTFDVDGYRARLDWFEPSRRLRLRPEEAVAVHLRVKNGGTERWPWGLDASPQVRLGHRVLGGSGEHVSEGPRSPLPHELRPGEGCIAPVLIQAPGRPGCYRVQVDLVHDPIRWFGFPLEIELDVV